MGDRRTHVAATATAADGVADRHDDNDASDAEDGAAEAGKKVLGKKKMAKLQAKEEARALREQQQALRDDRQERERLRAEEAKRTQEAEESREHEAAELERRRIDEKKRKEEEEYQAMKAMFSVENDGSVAQEIATESQGLLGEFVDFIKV